MKAIPASVLTLWMPAFLGIGVSLFLVGQPLEYWSICILIVPLLAYMNTLARIHGCDGKIRITRWWGSIYVSQSEILDISPCMLEGIGRLRLRRFVAPWGSIYFLSDWSNIEIPQSGPRTQAINRADDVRKNVSSLIASVLLGLSGFVLGRVLGNDFHALSTKVSAVAAAALTTSASLAVLFALTRKRAPVLANVLLFCAMLVVALV
jgi:hypothetical protein